MYLEIVRYLSCFQVGSYCGADGVDEWDEEKWQEEISKNQVNFFFFRFSIALFRCSCWFTKSSWIS